MIFSFCFILIAINIFGGINSEDIEEYTGLPSGSSESESEETTPSYDEFLMEDFVETTTKPPFAVYSKNNTKGKPWNLKITNWHIDGIRHWAPLEGCKFFASEDPDIIFLQETRCPMKKLPPETRNISGYKQYWYSASRYIIDGYPGLALYTKIKPLNIIYGVGIHKIDREGTLLTAEYEKFYLVNVLPPYILEDLRFLKERMAFDEALQEHVRRLDQKKPVIITGDFSVAHKEIDAENPLKNSTRFPGLTIEERSAFQKLLDMGFVDTFRHFYPIQKQAYTYWTWWGRRKILKIGWRFDYFLVSKRLMPYVVDSVIRSEVDIFSNEHRPITLFLHF